MSETIYYDQQSPSDSFLMISDSNQVQEGGGLTNEDLEDEISRLKSLNAEAEVAKQSAEKYASQLELEVDRLKDEALQKSTESLSLSSSLTSRAGADRGAAVRRTRMLSPQEMLEKKLNDVLAELESVKKERSEYEETAKCGQGDLEALQSEKEGVEEELLKKTILANSLAAQLEEKDTHLTQSRADVRSLTQQLDVTKRSHAQEVDVLGQQEASLNRKVAALSGDLKNEEEAKKLLLLQLQDVSSEKKLTEDLCSEYHTRITQLERAVEDGRRELVRKGDRIKQLEDQVKEAGNTIAHLDMQCRQYDDDFKEEREQREQEHDNVVVLNEHVLALQDENSSLRRDINELSKALQLKHEELEQLGQP